MLTELYLRANNWLEQEEGQGMVEYALILVLVSIVAIVALIAIGVDVRGVFNRVATQLQTTPE